MTTNKVDRRLCLADAALDLYVALKALVEADPYISARERAELYRDAQVALKKAEGK